MPDRRPRRTRRLLQEAMIALVAERGLGKITVQDVLDRADVGRSTFYAHFRDKEELFDSCFDDLRADLRRELDTLSPDGPHDQARPVAVIFDHVHRNRRVYTATGAAHLHQLIRTELRAHLGNVGITVPADVIVEYHTSALVGLLTWWIKNDFPHTPPQLAAMCWHLTAGSVRTVLTHPPTP